MQQVLQLTKDDNIHHALTQNDQTGQDMQDHMIPPDGRENAESGTVQNPVNRVHARISGQGPDLHRQKTDRKVLSGVNRYRGLWQGCHSR